jgi:hypothetical protein
MISSNFFIPNPSKWAKTAHRAYEQTPYQPGRFEAHCADFAHPQKRMFPPTVRSRLITAFSKTSTSLPNRQLRQKR